MLEEGGGGGHKRFPPFKKKGGGGVKGSILSLGVEAQTNFRTHDFSIM